MLSPLMFYYNVQFLEMLSMVKYNAHETALIRKLEKQNQLLTEQLKEQKGANLKLEDIKDILVMMLDKRQFEEYQEMIDAFEGVRIVKEQIFERGENSDE